MSRPLSRVRADRATGAADDGSSASTMSSGRGGPDRQAGLTFSSSARDTDVRPRMLAAPCGAGLVQ